MSIRSRLDRIEEKTASKFDHREFLASPEHVAFGLIPEADRRLILDIFETEEGREDTATILKRATPQELEAYRRYRSLVDAATDPDIEPLDV